MREYCGETFSKLDRAGEGLSSLLFEDCLFTGCRLEGALVENCQFSGCRFEGNGTDIDNRCGQSVDISKAVFE